MTTTRNLCIFWQYYSWYSRWKGQQKMCDRVRLYINVTHYFDVKISVLYKKIE